MSGVNRHPRLPRPVPPKRARAWVDGLLLWSVGFVFAAIVLAYLGVFDGLVGR